MKSPLNYFGGKSKLAKQIVAMIPEDHNCYCEAFSGAAWVLFNKEPSKAEVINDMDMELVTFWRVIQNHLQPFLEHYKYAIVSRKIFDWEQMKRPETLTDIQRAVRYFYLQRLSFGGRTDSRRTFGVCVQSPTGLNLSTVEERLLDVHWRLERVTIEHLDACDCIQRYDRPENLFYLDPPYFETAQHYAAKFGPADFDRLRELLSSIKGRFILSLNDHAGVRKLFEKFNMTSVQLTYSASNGRSAPGNRSVPRNELLIRNW